jgi:hypothetical protein
MKPILSILLSLFTFQSFSQDTTFYDELWKVSDINNATYYFTKPFRRVFPPEKADDIDTIKTNLIILKGDRIIKKIDFSYSLIPMSDFIGKKVKIYYNQHSYDNLNVSALKIDWPNQEIRSKSGKSYVNWKFPKNGDTVEIMWCFKYFPSEESKKSYPDNVYLVKYKDYYIPISGKGLTMVDKEFYSQFDTTIYKEKKIPISYVLAPGIIYQKQLFGELNLLFARVECGMCSPCVITGPFIGIESNFDQSNWIYGVKAGYQLAGLFLSLRGSMINYVENGHSDLRILPEIGISFLGIANLNYGYNIPLLNYESNLLSRHRLSLVINLSRDLW